MLCGFGNPRRNLLLCSRKSCIAVLACGGGGGMTVGFGFGFVYCFKKISKNLLLLLILLLLFKCLEDFIVVEDGMGPT